MKKIHYLIMIGLFFNLSVYSQEEEEEDFDDVFESLELDLFDTGVSYPSIEVNYGFTQASREKFSDMGKLDNIDLKFGTFELMDIMHNEESTGTLEYEFSHLVISTYDWNYGASEDQDALLMKSWSIGFGDQEGYGYKLGENSSIIFYHSEGAGMNWITERLAAGSFADMDEADLMDPLKVFGKSTRYYEDFEAGIKIQPFKNITINGAYERTLVYPRLLFWYSTVSGMTQGAAHLLASQFVKRVFRSMPMAVPVLDFILQNGISYGFYELRKSKMNWPIGKDTAPLLLDNIKVGVNINF